MLTATTTAASVHNAACHTQTLGGVCALPLLHILFSASGIANRVHGTVDTPGAAAALCPSSRDGELKHAHVAAQIDCVLQHARQRLGGDPGDALFSPGERARWSIADDAATTKQIEVVPVMVMSTACVRVALHVVRCVSTVLVPVFHHAEHPTATMPAFGWACAVPTCSLPTSRWHCLPPSFKRLPADHASHASKACPTHQHRTHLQQPSMLPCDGFQYRLFALISLPVCQTVHHPIFDRALLGQPMVNAPHAHDRLPWDSH